MKRPLPPLILALLFPAAAGSVSAVPSLPEAQGMSRTAGESGENHEKYSTEVSAAGKHSWKAALEGGGLSATKVSLTLYFYHSSAP